MQKTSGNPGTLSRPDREKPGRYYPWIVLGALFMIGVVAFGIRFSFGVFFKSLQQDFGWGRASTSSIFSLYMLLSAFFVIIGGWALDRFGARKVFTITGCFAGLGLLFTSRVNASWQLFITYSLFIALGTAPIYVNAMSTVSRWFPKKRGLALGIVSTGFSTGMIIVSPIAAYLITRYGWQQSYLILSLAAFFVTIPCAQLLKSPPEQSIETGLSGPLSPPIP